MRPLVDLVKFPQRDVQLAACIAINCITLGLEQITKSSVMTEHGLEGVMELADRTDDAELSSTAIYALGSLSENSDVKGRLVEIGVVSAAVKCQEVGNIEVKRACGYLFASLSEVNEFHGDLDKEHAIEAVIALAQMEDIECQEYAAFSLAHLASNKDFQVRLVNLGAVRPLVSMLASDAEPRHYAGLALLKLADNFENHLRIAEEGGIQALLRLGRTRSSDEQVQYKAAITVGQLASNAVKMFPNGQDKTKVGTTSASGRGGDGVPDVPSSSAIGTSSKMLDRLRGQVNDQKGRQITKDYFEKESAPADGGEAANEGKSEVESLGLGATPDATRSEINEEMAATDEIN